jgi:CheY-like chemotaxis protein
MGEPEPTDVSHELQGSRVALMGFRETEHRELRAIFDAAGCRSTSVGRDASPASLRRCDVLLISADDGELALLLSTLTAARRPWLLAGSLDEMKQYMSLCLHADEVVFQPWTAGELLLRVHRAMHRRAAAALPPLPEPRQPTVLVADDDPYALELVGAALDGHGLECHFATNGCEALDRTRTLLPDLVLLDLDMPVMTGFEVLRHIREDSGIRNTQVLLLTAAHDAASIQAGSALGADGYLVKPLNHMLLIGRVKRALAGRSERTGEVAAGWRLVPAD